MLTRIGFVGAFAIIVTAAAAGCWVTAEARTAAPGATKAEAPPMKQASSAIRLRRKAAIVVSCVCREDGDAERERPQGSV